MAVGHSQWTMPENSFICQGFFKPYIEELLERMNGFRPLAHSHPPLSQLYWLTHPLGWETGADTGVYRLSISERRWSPFNSCLCNPPRLGLSGPRGQSLWPFCQNTEACRSVTFSITLTPRGPPCWFLSQSSDREASLSTICKGNGFIYQILLFFCRGVNLPGGRVCSARLSAGLQRHDGLYRCCALKLWAPVLAINSALLMRVDRCIRLKWFFKSEATSASTAEGLAVSCGTELPLTPISQSRAVSPHIPFVQECRHVHVSIV